MAAFAAARLEGRMPSATLQVFFQTMHLLEITLCGGGRGANACRQASDPTPGAFLFTVLQRCFQRLMVSNYGTLVQVLPHVLGA